MTVVVTHTTPSDGSFSATGAAAWDANHALSGVGTMAEQNANNVAITGGSISGVTLPAGGSTLQVQYNNAGAFAGMSGSSWDNTNQSLTLGGATLTTSNPVLNLSQTWNNAAVTFTALKLNVTNTNSAVGSMLMDLQAGGATQFAVRKDGQVNISQDIYGGRFIWITNLAGYFSINGDAIFSRKAAANWRFGAADAAAPIAQTLSVQSVVAGTPNTAGADWTLTGSQSTGSGTSGNLIVSTAFSNTVGTATVTITIATPGVITWTAHGLVTGSPVVFTTTGALPTGITAGTTYYAITSSTLGVNTFQIATSAANAAAGTAITTSGTQSGVQTGTTSATVQSPLMTTTTFGPSGLTGSQATSLLNLSQTWNTSGTPTALKLNVTDTASNASSLLMDLQVGGVTKLNVTKSGQVTSAASLLAGTSAQIGWTGNTRLSNSSNGFININNSALTQNVTIGAPSTATLQLGAADAAIAVAQTLRVQSVVAGTTNTAGANLTITGSQGTGTGAGGSIVFQVAPAGSSGTAQNALAAAMTIDSVKTVRLGTGYTVATLPAAGTAGRYTYVTDALAPVYLGTLTGGGSVVSPVFDNGTAWVSA